VIPIMGRPSAYSTDVRRNALVECTRVGVNPDWYLRALEVIWCQCVRCGVDPVVAAAQCAHETGWGGFTGKINAGYGNTAGMKIRNPVNNDDRPENHARFALDFYNRPLVGALAQAHHLMLYAGHAVPLDTPDQRAVYCWPGTAAFGSAPNVEDLGGKWAPAKDYGHKVVAIYVKLVAV
jgi:hypothetical protein